MSEKFRINPVFRGGQNVPGVMATPTPVSFRTRLILSDVPCTYGIEVNCLN